MSATFNVQRFAEYFSFPLFGSLDPAPIIDVEKCHDQKTSLMIHKYYLCQLGILGEVSSLHVCKLGWRFVSHYYVRQFYVIWESYWSHMVGGIAREDRAHSSNKAGFSCFSAAAFASSNVLLCLITVVWKVKVFASFENIMTWRCSLIHRMLEFLTFMFFFLHKVT